MSAIAVNHRTAPARKSHYIHNAMFHHALRTEMAVGVGRGAQHTLFGWPSNGRTSVSMCIPFNGRWFLCRRVNDFSHHIIAFTHTVVQAADKCRPQTTCCYLLWRTTVDLALRWRWGGRTIVLRCACNNRPEWIHKLLVFISVPDIY